MAWVALACGVALVLLMTALLVSMVLKVRQARRTLDRPLCDFCGSHAVRLSAPHGLVDWLLENWHCKPHRCEVCFQRSYRFVQAAAD